MINKYEQLKVLTTVSAFEPASLLLYLSSKVRFISVIFNKSPRWVPDAYLRSYLKMSTSISLVSLSQESLWRPKVLFMALAYYCLFTRLCENKCKVYDVIIYFTLTFPQFDNIYVFGHPGHTYMSA